MKTLVLCEKPSSAANVALAIDDKGMPFKKYSRGVPYWECSTRQGPAVVCSALGHLYSLASKAKVGVSTYPIWDLKWRARKRQRGYHHGFARWIQVVGLLAKGSDRFINACDYDVEGSLIGLTVLRYACDGADSAALRMKFNTMTREALELAYRKPFQRLDLATADAGWCRHELDWLYGVNLSRALTQSALHRTEKYAALSTGRVQGPTLNFVVKREKEIESFVPTPFWEIEATIKVEGRTYELEYSNRKIATADEASRIVADCEGKGLAVEDLSSYEARQSPPYPFELSSLQADAFRHFHFTPARALALAEQLYLAALISYPRTSSQKLPADLGYEVLLRSLSQQEEYAGSSNRLLENKNLHPNQGPKDDPAHPAIYPTGELPSRALSSPARRLYDLVVRRFLATFGNACLIRKSTMTLHVGPHEFLISGLLILNPGWKEFYSPYVKEQHIPLPRLEQGESVPFFTISASRKSEPPPPRYNAATLVRRMEQAKIGTKATRADIVETLYKRGYVEQWWMQATSLAVQVTNTLSEVCPELLDPDLTAEIEERLDEIQNDSRSRRVVLLEAVENFRPAMLVIMEKEAELGFRLAGVDSSQVSTRRLWGGYLKLPRRSRSIRKVKTARRSKTARAAMKPITIGFVNE